MASDRAEIVAALGEVFREHGFEGASLALISEKTGLGKGSLYNYFPGGKDEMAALVLADIDAWFETHIFKPLREDDDPQRAIDVTLTAVDRYFRSGRRLCLVGVFAVGDAHERFGKEVAAYFKAWTQALAVALTRAGHQPKAATALAEDSVALIQGALILSRATPGAFGRTLERLRRRLAGKDF